MSVLLPTGREVGSHHPRRREPWEAGGSNGRQLGTTGHRWGPWGISQSYRVSDGSHRRQVGIPKREQVGDMGDKVESQRMGGQEPLSV